MSVCFPSKSFDSAIDVNAGDLPPLTLLERELEQIFKRRFILSFSVLILLILFLLFIFDLLGVLLHASEAEGFLALVLLVLLGLRLLVLVAEVDGRVVLVEHVLLVVQ